MGTGRKFNKKPVTRPKKGTGERARRVRLHKTRVLALGHTEEAIRHMTPADLRAILRKPVAVKSK